MEKKNRKRQHNLFANKYLVCNFTTFGTISVNHHKTIIKTLQTDKQHETSTNKTIRHVTYMFLSPTQVGIACVSFSSFQKWNNGYIIMSVRGGLWEVGDLLHTIRIYEQAMCCWTYSQDPKAIVRDTPTLLERTCTTNYDSIRPDFTYYISQWRQQRQLLFCLLREVSPETNL